MTGRPRTFSIPRIAVRVGVTAALTLALPASSWAQAFPSDAELGVLIQSRIDEGRAVGIAIGILEADGTERIVTGGQTGAGARPLGESSLFEIGSITKVFTGTLLADMVRRGEVSLADPVSRYLPAGVRMPARGGREITLLDLATHRSALPRLPGNLSPTDPSNPYADYSVQQMYDFLSGYELTRDVGAQFEYSNLGVGLLGHVLARAAGMPYEALVRERILEPLAMTRTSVALEGDLLGSMARGHNAQRVPVPLWDLPTLAGAGALRSTPADMLRFLEAQVGEPSTDLERAIRTTREPRQVASPPGGAEQTSVGLNWLIRSANGSRIVWHNGGTGGFTSFIGFDPDRGMGVVVLSNSQHSVDDIGLHLLDPAVPLTEAPRQRVAIELPANVLDDYVGEYQLAPQFSIVVTLEDGSLFIQATGQGKAPIHAEAEDAFFLTVVNAQITFQRAADGAVSGMTLHQNGQNLPGSKVR